AKGVKPSEITAIVLDRPRHAALISAVRATGAGIRLISDGDIAGIIFTTSPEETGVDIYLGTGAAPEG
ncbi:fructose-bisphosphatase class II, partial [Enterobacter cloacae]